MHEREDKLQYPEAENEKQGTENKNNKMQKSGFVYMLSNKYKTVLYIGVTNNLKRRMLEHKTGNGSVFTTKYNIVELMYFEKIIGFDKAIAREKQLKNWHKEWKWNFIKEENPKLKDLAYDWFTKKELEEYKLNKN